MENFIALMAKAVFLNVGECRCDVQQKVSLKNLEFYPDACEELKLKTHRLSAVAERMSSKSPPPKLVNVCQNSMLEVKCDICGLFWNRDLDVDFFVVDPYSVNLRRKSLKF